MKHILFINTQAFGDVLLGINAARRYKEEHPEDTVSFCLRDNFNLTTNDGSSGMWETIEVLEKQPFLDSVGIVKIDTTGKIEKITLNTNQEVDVSQIIVQYRWFSDLGISRSANHPLKEMLSDSAFNDGVPILEVGSEKLNDGILRVGTAGPLDWNRKLQSESLRLDIMYGIKDMLDARAISYELNLFGIDVSNYSLLQSLQLLKQQDVFISPLGSLVHSSAALGVDTISIASVFPARYDSPEFYATGYHKTVTALPENHCGSFKCIDIKNSINAEEEKNKPGNPTAQFGFWPRKCPFTSSGLSCTKTYKASQVLDEFESWLNAKRK
jgi:hypothetical protein